MNQSARNEMFADRRNHAMRTAHPQNLLPLVERDAAKKDRAERHRRQTPVHGAKQIGHALVGAALHNYQRTHSGERFHPLYFKILEYVRGAQ